MMKGQMKRYSLKQEMVITKLHFFIVQTEKDSQAPLSFCIEKESSNK
jgi:hypothetical protein